MDGHLTQLKGERTPGALPRKRGTRLSLDELQFQQGPERKPDWGVYTAPSSALGKHIPKEGVKKGQSSLSLSTRGRGPQNNY